MAEYKLYVTWLVLLILGCTLATSLTYTIIKTMGCPDCTCLYTKSGYVENCRMGAEKVRDSLIKDGYHAEILDVYAYHSIVNCSDCREDQELWFDSDGTPISARQNYKQERECK